MVDTSGNRRLGVRHGIEPVAIRWKADLARKGSLFKRRSGIDPHLGYLYELSVSGAAIVAPAAKDVQVGYPVAVDCMGVAGLVVVRRIEPYTDPSYSVYGVEFSDQGGALAGTLYDTFLAPHSSVPEWQDPRNRVPDGIDL
jgi:hypothetical protein